MELHEYVPLELSSEMGELHVDIFTRDYTIEATGGQLVSTMSGKELNDCQPKKTVMRFIPRQRIPRTISEGSAAHPEPTGHAAALNTPLCSKQTGTFNNRDHGWLIHHYISNLSNLLIETSQSTRNSGNNLILRHCSLNEGDKQIIHAVSMQYENILGTNPVSWRR